MKSLLRKLSAPLLRWISVLVLCLAFSPQSFAQSISFGKYIYIRYSAPMVQSISRLTGTAEKVGVVGALCGGVPWPVSSVCAAAMYAQWSSVFDTINMAAANHNCMEFQWTYPLEFFGLGAPILVGWVPYQCGAQWVNPGLSGVGSFGYAPGSGGSVIGGLDVSNSNQGGTSQRAAPACSNRPGAKSDANTGQSWPSASYCRNHLSSPLYAGPGRSSKMVVGYLDTTNSWFACYQLGEWHEGGNNVWYYTQGDRTASLSERHAWGYIPAVNVWTDSDPYPGIPRCASPVFTFADIDGDRRAEKLEVKPNGEVWAWHNGGGLCGYYCTYDWASIIATGFTDTAAVRFADIDGDGRAEIIQLKTNGEVWAWHNGHGLCGYNCTYDWASIIATGFTDIANVQFADIDGDGRAEIIYLKPNGEVWTWHNGRGLCGYNCTFDWASIIATGFTDRANVRFADIDGDRRAEIVQLRTNGETWTWHNGRGLCGYNCTYDWASIIAVGFSDTANVLFSDVDGDGRSEIVQLHPNGEIRTWHNGQGLCGYNCTYDWASIVSYR